ncbi:DUF349 domain-containing protein [Marinobacter sp. VGCF2001]|uniref:DUF349 domain-containing protein n=1 Tax=Marinobacter sp. VGCF2001 TaxID=3417189 RepID=UPI003CF2066D
MAAFIQKLFKKRKTVSLESQKASGKQETNQPTEADKRQQLRQQQESQLAANPGQAALTTLAVQGVTSAIRLNAARDITDEDKLQEVLKQTKGRDKSVYQAVKQSLQALKEQQANEAATRQRIDELVDQAQEQAKSEDTKRYEARLTALQERWRDVEAQAPAGQAQQFLAAVHQIRERLKELEDARREEQRHQDQKHQRQETLELLQQTLAQLKGSDSTDLPSESALDALQKTQENRWLEATRETQVDKHEQKQYEQSMLALRNYLSAVRRLNAVRMQISELESDEADNAQADAKAILQEVDWPRDFPLPPTLSNLSALAGKPKKAPSGNDNTEQQQALVAALNTTLPKLETALEAKQFRESRQLLKTAQHQLQGLDGHHRKAFQAKMQLLTGQFRELSDWQGFATEPKQVSLCEQMEYLAEQPIEPEAKAERIKELQNDWRELGGSSDRVLWKRFKAASDQAYEPCKAYFEAKADLKQVHLQKRQAICDELEHFLAEADWSTIDWKGAERIHQTARQEWKAAWPVDFRDNRKVQKHFDDLLKKLERPLDEERQKNEAAKQAIIERAEALIDHEPLQEAMDQAKALQSEWKSIGITRHREDRKLWQAFRNACDQIFERRSAQRSAQQQATEEADTAAQATLERYRNLDTSTSDETLEEARTALKTLAAGSLSRPVRDDVQQLRDHLAKLGQLKKLQARLESWKTLVHERVTGDGAPEQTPSAWQGLVKNAEPLPGRDLAIRAEILAGRETPEADQGRRMEIQVQRLADGLGNGDNSEPAQELEKLVALWCLQPGDEGITREHADRLVQALESHLQQ